MQELVMDNLKRTQYGQYQPGYFHAPMEPKDAIVMRGSNLIYFV